MYASYTNFIYRLSIDQTPTPTKFLRNCEEIGLFNVITNPFDVAFSQAVEDKEDEPSSTQTDDVSTLASFLSLILIQKTLEVLECFIQD